MDSGRRCLRSAVAIWELAQVELHGRVSGDRVQKLQPFLDHTSFAKAVLVCIALPLPCVLTLTALEAIPLASTTADTLDNYAFWLRHLSTLIVLSPGILSNFRSFLPELNITRKTTVMLSVMGALASGGSALVVSLFIGFPVPFTLLVSAPGWLVVIIPPIVVIYKSRLRYYPDLLWRFIRCWFIIGWLAVSVVLYPIYVYGFHRLGSIGQVFYVGLLPVIKMTGRNVISRLIGDRYDVKAEIVIFNVEVFNALYMSVALQSSAKLTTTLAVMAVDVVQSVVAVRDIDKMMESISRVFTSNRSRRSESICQLVFDQEAQTMTPHQPSIAHSKTSSNLKLSSVIPNIPHGSPLSSTDKMPTYKGVARIHPSSLEQARMGSEANIKSPSGNVAQVWSKQDKKKIATKAARVLFTAEFVLLDKYVEAMVPAIYAAFVAIAYNTSNRQYYSQFDSITPSNLSNTILNVLTYCLLKTLSFWIMCHLISRRVGISAIHLVAFVLLYQWEAVFSKILTWVVYTTLTSLQHSGTCHLQSTRS